MVWRGREIDCKEGREVLEHEKENDSGRYHSVVSRRRGVHGVSVCRADTFFDFQYLMNENNMKGIQVWSIRCGCEYQNNQGMTILMAAVMKSNTQVVELLLNNGADVNAKTDDGMTPDDCRLCR